MLFVFVSCTYVFVILKLIVHISLKVNQILLKCDKVFVLHMQLFSSNQQNPCEPALHIATETLRACLFEGPRWQSGNTLASHLCGRGSIPVMAVSGKAGSCLPLVGSLQYRTLVNYMYWFPLPFQLPVVI